jgi:hypothetical protein
MLLKDISARFSQEQEVGVKCRVIRGFFAYVPVGYHIDGGLRASVDHSAARSALKSVNVYRG